MFKNILLRNETCLFVWENKIFSVCFMIVHLFIFIHKKILNKYLCSNNAILPIKNEKMKKYKMYLLMYLLRILRVWELLSF